MKSEPLKVFKAERFSIEYAPQFGVHCIAFPVFNGLAEYDEFYRISPEELEHFNQDFEALKAFVEECRKRLHDDRLLEKPGRLRGSPC